MSRLPGATGLLAATIFLQLVGAVQADVPAPPAVEGRSYILVDFQTGKVLAKQNEHERVEPASITKLMTAYVAFRALKSGQVKLTDEAFISERAWREGGAASGGSATFLPLNSRVPIEILLQGMIIQSGNDASMALAEHLGGSEEGFADLMNQYAKELGMTGTHYTNSPGLPHPEHYTTAADVAILGRAIIREFPEYYRWYSQKDFTYNGIKQGNRNLLLYRDPTVDGLKTGHTESAGYCLVSSAKRNDMRLIAVVMGTSSPDARAKASLELLNYGFRAYETRRLYQAGSQLAEARVWKGNVEKAGLGLREDIWVTLPRGSLPQVQAGMQAPKDIIAPVDAAAEVGRLRLTLSGESLADAPLFALTPVTEGSWWRQAADTVLLWFE
jgi:D-alanyl-D-alanine carboxypeptidase (penicillin-binding protein 5/6)